MIEIKPKVHDRFSVEFKMGFLTDRTMEENDFTVGMWLFVPDSLDITPTTFTKNEFYRCVKSNVRLVTPQFALGEIVGGKAVPLQNVRNASGQEYPFQVKMFAGITKSALRNERNRIEASDETQGRALCLKYISDCKAILDEYFGLPSGKVHEFCGEFICNCMMKETAILMKRGMMCDELAGFAAYLNGCRESRGYPSVREGDREGNSSYVHRSGVLKKFVESQLYLRTPKKRDGIIVEQAYFSLAAGLAMLFATIVAWIFQRKFGNLTWPLFIALIISYMMKDRIKDLMRYYFAHRVSDRYFDNKAVISYKGHSIGWLKEAMDFVPPVKVPDDIRSLRNRIHLFEAEDFVDAEKVILYRKKVRLNRSRLEENTVYDFSGINDIIRLQVRPFLRKMDDPEVKLNFVDGEGRLNETVCDKNYYLNMVFQYRHGSDCELKRYRITLNRDGIKSIDEIR